MNGRAAFPGAAHRTRFRGGSAARRGSFRERPVSAGLGGTRGGRAVWACGGRVPPAPRGTARLSGGNSATGAHTPPAVCARMPPAAVLRRPSRQYRAAKNPVAAELIPAAAFTPIDTSGDSLDWKGISAAEISKRVLSRVKPGSIILFHNAAKHTPEALPEILETLLSRGYKIVPVSALVIKGRYNVDYTIDHTGRQIAKTAPKGAASDQSAPAPAKKARDKKAKAAKTGKTTSAEIRPEKPVLKKAA